MNTLQPEVSALQLWPTNDVMLVGCVDGTVRAIRWDDYGWDADVPGKMAFFLPGHVERVEVITATSGSHFTTASADRIRMWQFTESATERPPKEIHGKPVDYEAAIRPPDVE